MLNHIENKAKQNNKIWEKNLLKKDIKLINRKPFETISAEYMCDEWSCIPMNTERREAREKKNTVENNKNKHTP